MELIIVQHNMLLTAYSAIIALLEWTRRYLGWQGDWVFTKVSLPDEESWGMLIWMEIQSPLSTVDAKLQELNSKQWLFKQIVYLVSFWLIAPTGETTLYCI